MTQMEYKKLYKEIEVIGRGNFGSATLVERLDTKRQYIAKKIVLSSLNTKQQDAALQEAFLLKDLNHKNIVSYVENFKEDDLLIIIMEYCEQICFILGQLDQLSKYIRNINILNIQYHNGDLAFHIKRKKLKKEHFPEMLIVNWFFEIALSIKYIHERKILHRDIKTSNIFITKDGTIKIGDFGISKVLENTTSVAKTFVGTPYYMSPEVCESKPYTYKSDVWALGCVLFELCALEHAFESNNLLGLIYKIVKQDIQDIPNIYSKELNELIHKLLNKNEQERPMIHEILNDISTQKLIKQYLSIGADATQVKQETIQNVKKPNKIQSQQPLQQAGNKIEIMKNQNKIQNQLQISNKNDKLNFPSLTELMDTQTPINTVESYMYQVSANYPLHKCSSSQQLNQESILQPKETDRIKIKSSGSQRLIIMPEPIKSISNDGTHDEYYDDGDNPINKPKRQRCDEKTILQQNNFLKSNSPLNLRKLKPTQNQFPSSKQQKDENINKIIDISTSTQHTDSQSNSVPHKDKMYQNQRDYNLNSNIYNTSSNLSVKGSSNLFQQNPNYEYYQQQQNLSRLQKMTPKQILQFKKEEKNKQKQQQLNEYTKSQYQNTFISRERYIQNVYGDKFLPNQSNLKQNEENTAKQKPQVVLGPISSIKGQMKNNFLSNRENSPSNLQRSKIQNQQDSQYQQIHNSPIRNGSGWQSSSQYNQLIKNEENRKNSNVYSNINFPEELPNKSQALNQSNSRRTNQNSKNEIMTILQEEKEQNKQFYNQINKYIPTVKSQFAQDSLPFSSEGKRRIINVKPFIQQDNQSQNELINQENIANKINNAFYYKRPSQNLESYKQDPQYGGVCYSATNFDSGVDQQYQNKNTNPYQQELRIKKVESDGNFETKSPQQNSFEHCLSYEDLTQQPDNKLRVSQQKIPSYKTKVQPNLFNQISNQKQYKTQRSGSDDEYCREQFEDYLSEEDALQIKQGKEQHSKNNTQNQKDTLTKNSMMGINQGMKQITQSSQALESIQENDIEQSQVHPLGLVLKHQSSNPILRVSVKKNQNGIPPFSRMDSYNSDSGMNGSKKISHQSSINSTDDQPSTRMSNNQSRNSPRNINSSAFKTNTQQNSNQKQLSYLRSKCKQNLGESFEKVYDIIQNSIVQNIQNYKMKQQLIDLVGKQKINDCFDVEQLIYKEGELKKQQS